jgi:hypothetical protein
VTKENSDGHNLYLLISGKLETFCTVSPQPHQKDREPLLLKIKKRMPLKLAEIEANEFLGEELFIQD